MPDDRSTIDYASPDVAAKRMTNVWATLGCVLAVGFLVPPVALAGAIASWIGLLNSANPHIGGRRAALIGLRLGLIGLALTPVEIVTLRWARQKADAIKCQSNISAIAQCVFMYANNNHDQLPPDLPRLAVEEGLGPGVFFCPAQKLTTGIYSYDYLRAGQRLADVKNPAIKVMLYEDTDHFGGMNIAFYDGHVEFVPRRKASKVLAELRAGQNPPLSLAAP